jgi:hypothetical protein
MQAADYGRRESIQKHHHNGECDLEEETGKRHFLRKLIVSVPFYLWENVVWFIFFCRDMNVK